MVYRSDQREKSHETSRRGVEAGDEMRDRGAVVREVGYQQSSQTRRDRLLENEEFQ
jgi:hypothetical protein